MIISNKIKGLFRVSSANLFALGASLVTSFVLPLAISVEQYGYWQLYSLYLAYIGFFVLGFNDGIHLNYSSCEYNSDFQKKFKTFFIYLSIVSIAETLLLAVILFFTFPRNTISSYLAIIVALNLLPTALDGLFLYMSQGTLRFKEYSLLSIIDKALFLVIMVCLLILKVENALYYIIAYTAIRYLSLIYVYYSAKEVFKAEALPIKAVGPEIKNNYFKGFPLMIAGILGGPSLIVGGRLLVQNKMGIESFSAYSFSLNTIVIAAQFISAVATVFYPILKRTSKEDLPKMYASFDKVTTLFSIVLLLSYYPAALLVNLLYVKYSSILSYLFVVYPLFIYQCKSNVLIVNAYKVKNSPVRLILVNIIGIAIHLLCIFIAYSISPGVGSIALATLFSLALWYYVIQWHIHKVEGWNFKLWKMLDAVLVIVFILANLFLTIMIKNINIRLIVGFVSLLFIVLIIYRSRRGRIRSIVKEFTNLMKD